MRWMHRLSVLWSATEMVTRLLLLVLSCTVGAMTSSEACGVEPTIIRDHRPQSDGGVIDGDGRRFPAGCFWESLTNDNSSTLILGCDSKVTCLWKCCPQGQVLDTRNKCITPNNHTFHSRFNTSRFHILTGNPCVDIRFKLDDDKITNIEDDGMLREKLPDGDGQSLYPAGGFCLDHFENGTSFETVALVCYPTDEEVVKMPEERRDDVTFLIYTIGRLVALPFLIATVAVYAVIPELRNLHGKCLVSHVTSLSVAYVFLIVIALGGKGLATWFCVSSALIVYFFLLGSFFWLNVMCFDIWWTFSGHRRVIGSKGSNEQKEFMFYSLYAWGAPVVMLCVSLIIDFAPNVPDSYIKPEFGVHKCWFKDKVTVLAYFSGPVAFLIASNIVFFVVTAFNILTIRKQTSVLSNADSRRSDNRRTNEQRFLLYLKLFVVMGVTWSLDLIGWAIGGPDYIWWVTDLANILQGVLIFLIFVWKTRVRRLLKQRFNCLPLQSSTSPTASTAVMGSYT